MNISYMAMNRIVEERAAEDDSYRRGLERNGRTLLSHGRGMSDDALLEKLRELGFDAERQGMLDAMPRFVSAQGMSVAMLADAEADVPESEEDWVWIATTCLWERWRPDLPNMEMVDDKMQAGYASLKRGDILEACRLWLETWHAILDIIDRHDMRSLDAFDGHFGGTQSVFNWVQDLETELRNAGLREPTFSRERMSLCQTMVDRFSDGNLSIGNFKRALAESYFESGDREKGDSLFHNWLEESPQWGWGWIGWSDCYWLFANDENKNAARAEQILQKGLASPGVEDRTHILERLKYLYEETGRNEEAESIRNKIARAEKPKTMTVMVTPQSAQVKQTFDFGDQGLPLEQLPDLAHSLRPPSPLAGDPFEGQRRARRNDPCPCGSGKKFKKCCGRR